MSIMDEILPQKREHKDLSRNKLCILALRFWSDLFDPKTQNHRNSSNYFEDFAVEDRSKMA